MTALEIVQAAYPGIPFAILNQFAALLPAEASALNVDFASTDAIFFRAYQNALKPVQSATFSYSPPFARQIGVIMSRTVSLLNPQNTSERVIKDNPCTFTISETVNRISTAPFWAEAGPHFSMTANFQTIYDRRLFSAPSLAMVSRQCVAQELNNYANAQAYGQYIARTISNWRITFQTAKYSGIDAIKVLYENGVTIPEINYDDVYTFSTYISAYKKFATQIDAEKNLLEQQARNTVNAYRQQLDDQAAREYADLQAKKIQLLIAIDNDAKSAQRDFQNMLLTAQGLKNQIGGNLA